MSGNLISVFLFGRFGNIHGAVHGIFFFIPAVDIFTAKGFDRCKDGYTDEHTQRAHDAAAYQNGKDDPQRAQIQRVAQDLGTKEIAVKLLQDQDEDTHPDSQNRIDQQGDADSRYRTDERTKVRDHIGHTEDQAQDQRKRSLHEGEPDESQNPDDQRIDRFADNEILKNMMYTVDIDEKALCFFLGRECVYTFPEFSAEAFFVIKHIKGDKDGHDKLNCDPTEYIDVAGNGFQYLRRIFRCMLDRSQNTVDDIVDIFTVDKGDLVEDFLDTDIHRFGINGDICCKSHDGFLYFRNQVDDDPDRTADDDGVVDQDGKDPSGFFVLHKKFAAFFQHPVKKIHEGIHDIGNGKTHQERSCQSFQIAGCCSDIAADAGQIADDFFK